MQNQPPLAGIAIPPLIFLAFFGFFLCSSTGGEYVVAALMLAPVPGFAIV